MTANRDPNFLSSFTGGHKRSPSGESLGRNLAGAKLVLPPAGEIPQLKPVDKSFHNRPKLPPPPGPPPADKAMANGQSNESLSSIDDAAVVLRKKVSKALNSSHYGGDFGDAAGEFNSQHQHAQLDNSLASSSGGNIESANSSFSRNDTSGASASSGGIGDSFNSSRSPAGYHGYPILRRCRALYDCNADNDDELEFKEGEILIVLNERTDDDNWMEGEIEGDSSRRGMFPVSFVQMLDE